MNSKKYIVFHLYFLLLCFIPVLFNDFHAKSFYSLVILNIAFLLWGILIYAFTSIFKINKNIIIYYIWIMFSSMCYFHKQG